MSQNLLGGEPAAPVGLQPVLGRECGDCALCCKLLPIPDFKPAGPWCQFCSTHKGCDAYDTRPQPCRTFFCSWMVDAGLGEEWQPMRARMLLTLTQGDGAKPQMRVVVDPSRPDAWRKEPYLTNFRNWANQFYVIVTIGERRVIIFPDHEKDLGIIPEGDTLEFVEEHTPNGIRITAQVRKQ